MTPNTCLIEDKKIVFQKEEKKEEFKFPLYINTEIEYVNEEGGYVFCIYDNQEIVNKLMEWAWEKSSNNKPVLNGRLHQGWDIDEDILKKYPIYIDGCLVNSGYMEACEDDINDSDSLCLLMVEDENSIINNKHKINAYAIDAVFSIDYPLEVTYYLSTYSLRNSEPPTREELLQRRQEIIQKYLENKQNNKK